MEWLLIGQTLIKTISDLHIKSGGNGPSFKQAVTNWVYSDDGKKLIGDIDQLLAEINIPIVIAIRRKTI